MRLGLKLLNDIDQLRLLRSLHMINCKKCQLWMITTQVPGNYVEVCTITAKISIQINMLTFPVLYN